ncbi:MAG: hypothetical protein JF615_03240 [Asticcacaulis sp.]|nr:hypothetical protein [Asticcacaulis sp.]
MTDAAKSLLRQAYRKRNDGDIEGALTDYAAATAIFADVGNSAGQAHCLRHLGDILREADRPAEAVFHLRAAENLYHTLDDPLGLANTLRPLALLAGDTPEAAALWREARTLYRQVGVVAGVEECDAHLPPET